MYSKFYLLLTTFVAATALWTSCDDPQTCDCDPLPPTGIGGIQIVTGSANDTLYFLPNDSASVAVIVIVTDWHGQPYPGAIVDVSLSDPSLGVIEFTDPQLRDTTNSLGHVNMAFRAYGHPGEQVITATAGGITDSHTLIMAETGVQIAGLTLLATPTTHEADEDDISVSTISVTVFDADSHGVPGLTVAFSASGGEFTAAQPTNQHGRTQCHWVAEGISGQFRISARIGAFSDSVRVTVYENPGIPTFSVSASRTYIEADSAEEVNVLVTALLRNSFGEGIANAPILISASAGLVPESCHTNSNGICQFVWSFMNDFGIFQLFAEYEPFGLRDTLMVEVRLR